MLLIERGYILINPDRLETDILFVTGHIQIRILQAGFLLINIAPLVDRIADKKKKISYHISEKPP